MHTRTPAQDKPDTQQSFDAMLEKFRAYRETRDPALRDELICTHLPLVYTIAHRYHSHSEPLDDLIQEGSIGLLKAVDYFDPNRGVRFSTYACHLITSQILHYLRDCGHLIRQPAWVQELNTKITRVSNKLTQQLDRPALPEEIAAELNLTVEAVQEVISAQELNRIISITTPSEDGEDNPILLIDKDKIRQAHHHTLSLPIEDRIVLEEAINRLKQLEQQVLRLFFYGNMTLSEIASRLSISTPRSAYLLRSSINKIKAGMMEQQRTEKEVLLKGRETMLEQEIPTYDKLTGIHSASFFLQRLEQECLHGRRYGGSCAVLLLSIIGYARRECDASLGAAVGQLIAQTIEGSDVPAYLGDGRFGILLLKDGKDAKDTTERIRDEVFLQLETQDVDLSIASGIAVFPADGVTSERLLKRAEQLLAASCKAAKRQRKIKSV
ncbi:MAG: sigma-70 family RNA polymerase sigma factor [Armatimonadota bacterium]